jgi:phage terminase large subunit GpA-like protein
MTRRINLPPGCRGFNMQDGTPYSGTEGGHVYVEDEHAPYIQRQVGGDAGLVGSAAFREFAGTRDGRWCQDCRFLAQRWSVVCPRCGRDTIPEAEMPEPPRADMPSDCAVIAMAHTAEP